MRKLRWGCYQSSGDYSLRPYPPNVKLALPHQESTRVETGASSKHRNMHTNGQPTIGTEVGRDGPHRGSTQGARARLSAGTGVSVSDRRQRCSTSTSSCTAPAYYFWTSADHQPAAVPLQRRAAAGAVSDARQARGAHGRVHGFDVLAPPLSSAPRRRATTRGPRLDAVAQPEEAGVWAQSQTLLLLNLLAYEMLHTGRRVM